ncbi:MAG: VanW family protein [Bacillota bacterium]|nr:VanW family protein [Bacillota bacterium]
MKKSSKKFTVILLSTLVMAAVGGAASYTGYAYKISKDWEGVIYPNTKVMGVEVGGMTKDEAAKLLKEKYGDVVVQKKIEIKYNGKSYSIDYSKLNARYNIDEVVSEAFSYGKELSIFGKKDIIKEGTDKSYNLTFNYDTAYIDELIKTMEKDINAAPVDGSIQMVSRGNFKVTPDKKGYKLQSDKLKEDIKNNINDKLEESSTTVEAPVETLSAVKTAEALSSINTLVSTYTTSYKGSIDSRINNIKVASGSVNGRLMMPGDSFSFNDVVGQRTEARGYQQAGVIINGKHDFDFGGGICQVSSTLYNALLLADIDPTERTHHTLRSLYVPLGQDATVDWGHLDLKFTNTMPYPIYIEAYTEGTNVYFNIYSNSSLTKKTYKIVNDVYQTVDFKVTQKQDPTLPEGTQEYEEVGSNGYRVRVYRVTNENGQQVKKDLLYEDYYKPVNAILKIGTKKVDQTQSN